MSSGRCAVIGVRMNPGWIEFTRMFNGASSRAADLARPRTAHLDATYGCTAGAPRSPSIDDTLMIEPPPAAVIGSTATRMPRKVPVRLTSITFCHLAKSKFFSWPSATMPALLTRTLSFPNSPIAVATAASHWSGWVTSRWT